MSTYRLVLTPTLRHAGTEGSMDSSIVNGYSIQRTGYIDVPNSSNRKIVAVSDGETFTDTMQVITDNPVIVAG